MVLTKSSLTFPPREGPDGMLFHAWTFLIVAVLCTFGLAANLFGYTIRPERAFVAVWLLASLPLIRKVGRHKASLLLLSWIGVGLYSSLTSIQPGGAFRHWADLSLAVSFFLVGITLPLHSFITRRPSALMWVAMILGASAVATAVVHSFYFSAADPDKADPVFSLFVMNDYIGTNLHGFRVRMTLMEANLFGIAMAIFSLLSIAEFRKSDRWTWLPFVLSHVGLLLAMSRSPLIGYAVGLAVYLVVAKDKRLMLKLVGTAFALLAFFPVELPFGTTSLHGQAMTSLHGQAMRDQTLAVRFMAASEAMPDVYNAPIVGNGIYSFSFLHPDFYQKVGAKPGEQAWLCVMPLAVLHDTGLLGVLLLYSFFAIVLIRGYRATIMLRQYSDSQYVRRATAWLGAAVSVSVASITTPAYSLSLFWGVFAVCYAIPRIVTAFKIQNGSPMPVGV